jgi:hypothetical protein
MPCVLSIRAIELATAKIRNCKDSQMLLARHGRARPGHPRLFFTASFVSQRKQGVDARHEAGHDG